MKDDSFILVSLKDDKSKKLAQILTNDSSRTILEYLSKKEEATESEIAKDLKLPVSTVHYNIKHLSEGGIITGDKYHYSDKGKEVIHYSLANKFIIIAPKSTFGFKQKLRSILPTAIIAGGAAVLIKLFSRFNIRPQTYAADTIVNAKMQEAAAFEAVEVMAARGVDTAVEQASQYALFSDIALWFFFGVLFTILIFLGIEYIRSIKQR